MVFPPGPLGLDLQASKLITNGRAVCAEVVSVIPGSPAASTGAIHPGHIIASINGKYAKLLFHLVLFCIFVSLSLKDIQF